MGLFIIITTLHSAFHSVLFRFVSAVVMMKTDAGEGGESLEWEAEKSKMHNFFFFVNERGEGGLRCSVPDML